MKNQKRKEMKTIKITSRLNGVVIKVREFEISDNALERFSNKIKEMKERKEERMKKTRELITPELIEKLKEMNKNKSPG